MAAIAPARAQETQTLCKDLEVRKLTGHSYLHISNITLANGSVFPCNGIVYVNNGEAIVLDTPTNDSLSRVLIAWVERELGAHVTMLVVNHFHEDATGGLQSFIDHGCATYSSKLTRDISRAKGLPLAEHVFTDSLTLLVGGQKVHNRYFGEAHTQDNITTYIPSEQLLFGGCMVKELGAGYGNLADANVAAWPATVRKVKAAYPGAGIVVPGHGREGSTALLDYTITLFEGYRE